MGEVLLTSKTTKFLSEKEKGIGERNEEEAYFAGRVINRLLITEGGRLPEYIREGCGGETSGYRDKQKTSRGRGGKWRREAWGSLERKKVARNAWNLGVLVWPIKDGWGWLKERRGRA